MTTTGASPARWPDLLRIAEFRGILTAHVISLLGTAIAQVALAVLVYQRTESPFLTALTFTLSLLPSLVAGTLLSALADRFPARRVLVTCELLGAAVVALMAVPGLGLPILLALVFVLGATGTVFVGTRAALLPEVLSPSAYPLGRAMLRVLANVLQIAGYLVGGALLLFVPVIAALLLDAATFLVSALLIWRATAAHDLPARGAGGVVRASLDGLRTALRTPRLRSMLLLMWLPPAFAVVPEAVAVVYAGQNGLDTVGLGVLLTGSLVGAVLGELAVGQYLGDRARQRGVLPLAALLALPLLGFLFQPSLPFAALLLVLSGLGFGYTLGLDRLLLNAVAGDVRQRVLNLAATLPMAAQGLAFAVAGAVAEVVPAHLVIVAGGVLALVTAALCAGPVLRAGRAA
ncbi:MFS transporter [Amycolatopsis antarctica]|uniref:MFS transporter n=1 Tax=Amycolatopsis antarctica TaxID=1854586 RepID=A0A263CW82_9PSEU|nr:MFS transporter [Amycolatopsis antarctica]OZM70351.1 MFS transporter [Amycolatopsis antarctica]